MNKVLVYKCAKGMIHECHPSPKEWVQKWLSSIGKDAYRAERVLSLEYEKGRGEVLPAQVHERRLEWLAKVVDFNNITDEEFQDFVHCDTPSDHKYHHWIDKEKMPQDRTLRVSWCDIDKDGNISHHADKQTQELNHV